MKPILISSVLGVKGEKMRLIDADALPFNVDFRPYRMKYVPYRSIEDAPTIDAVPVVRCKDCRKWCICHKSDDYYCADGERREDGQ